MNEATVKVMSAVLEMVNVEASWLIGFSGLPKNQSVMTIFRKPRFPVRARTYFRYNEWGTPGLDLPVIARPVPVALRIIHHS